jgi:hypothetical protein
MPPALSVAVQVAAEAKIRCNAQLSQGVVFLEPAVPTADRLCALRSFALSIRCRPTSKPESSQLPLPADRPNSAKSGTALRFPALIPPCQEKVCLFHFS